MNPSPLSSRSIHGPIRAQQGVALVIALVFLMVMTLLVTASIQDTSQQEMMASNTNQRNLAFQGAEACARWGETGWGTSSDGLHAAVLPTFNNSTPGLRQPITAAELGTQDVCSFWSDTYCWTAGGSCSTAQSQTCPLPSGLSQAPQFVIEELQLLSAPGSSVKFSPLPSSQYYRVTTRSQGGTADAVVILQTIYKR